MKALRLLQIIVSTPIALVGLLLMGVGGLVVRLAGLVCPAWLGYGF